MKEDKMEKDPSILEAVDNLSSMAELDIDAVKADNEGIAQLRAGSMRWLDASDERKTLESVKSTIKVVLNYLKNIYTKEINLLKDKSTQKGIASIMNLAKEAVDKIDEYAKQCKKKINISNSAEYIELLEYYNQKIKPRFSDEKKTGEEEEEEEDPEELSDINRRGLKDLSAVTRDLDYELFYLQKENGGKFYNMSLARHIRLVADFDQIISGFTTFDPLTKVPLLKDDIAFHLCKQMKDHLRAELDEIFKTAGKHKDDPLVQNVFRGAMALLLAANVKNQLKITTGKSVSGYFKDFQTNIRLALSSIDYRNYIDNPPEEEFYRNLLNLLHRICMVIYTSYINSAETTALLDKMLGDGKKIAKKSSRSSTAIWNTLLNDYEILASVLSKCPNGPLFKVLDILNEAEAFMEFDPIIQGDFPGNYFTLSAGGKEIQFLKIPSPTMQTNIDSANLCFEFTGFLRGLIDCQKKLLLISFQDRTSWKEYARANALEKAAVDGELGLALTTITLPKHTEFYNQSDMYLTVESAQDFKKVFIKQLEGEEDCGYCFPKKMDRAAFGRFCKKMIQEVHLVFFGDKNHLSRKNRLDFIEIVYHMLYLYFMELENYDYVAFSAKDGVDLSSLAIASMFAFLKSLSKSSAWKVEEEEFMMEMIYSSALIVRERVPHLSTISRSISMLSVVTAELELDKQKIHGIIQSLFGKEYEGLNVERFVA